MTIVGNHCLQAMRHVATNACNEVEVGCCPFLCNEAFEFVHRFRVPSIHSSLEIIPYFLDWIEIRAPCGPVDEVNAVIVKSISHLQSPDNSNSTCQSLLVRAHY